MPPIGREPLRPRYKQAVFTAASTRSISRSGEASTAWPESSWPLLPSGKLNALSSAASATTAANKPATVRLFITIAANRDCDGDAFLASPTVVTALSSSRGGRNDKNRSVGGRREAPVAWAPVRNARLPPESAIGADLLDLVRRCQGGDPEAWRAFLSPLQDIGRRALRSFRLPPPTRTTSSPKC